MTYRNLIFLHIPKAAGTTLHPVLERHYSKKNTLSFWENVDKVVKEFPEWPLERRRQIRLLKGHMPFGLHRYLVGESKYITLLREPAERIVSHYFYVKRTPRHYLYQEVVDRNISLSDYVSSGITEELDNGQVRLLAGIDRSLPFGSLGVEHLELAKENIEKHFAVAGLSERFDETLALMAIELGWNWIPYYQNLNVTKDKPMARQIDPLVLEVINNDNQLDFELYKWVFRRFEERLGFYREEVSNRIARLNRANKIYRPLNNVTRRIRSIFRDS